MITTDRNITLTCHVTNKTKEAFRSEAARRQSGMSELLSSIIEGWLEVAPSEQIENKRGNRRIVTDPDTGISIGLVDRFETGLKKSVDPNHIHHFNRDGKPICGCKYKDVPLPLDEK